MKRIFAILFALFAVLGTGCAQKDPEIYELLPLEFKMYYGRGHEKAGELAERGEVVRYAYDGKSHKPLFQAFYNGLKVFPAELIHYRFVEETEDWTLTERGTYKVYPCILGLSDLYETGYLSKEEIAANTYTIIIE